MKTLGEIKQLMAVGDTAQADEALKELLANEPDNLQAKMLYGTCRQLLGDEETFKRIHDELAPRMEELAGDPPTAETATLPETLSLWKKYQTLWEYMIVAGLVAAGAAAAIWYFGKTLSEQAAVALYGGPRYYETKHAVPPDELIKVNKFTTSGEDVDTIR